MNKYQMEALREWVRAEIEYAMASNEEGSDGYRQSAHSERDYAENCYQKMVKQVEMVE